MPMIGTLNTSEKKVSFKTAGAVIKLVCYNVADEACKLVVTSDTKKLSGEFTPSGSPASIVTDDKGASDNTITINFAAGHPNTMVFYIPVPTGDLGKLSFVVKDGSDAAVSNVQETKGSITMERQHIVAAPALNCSPSELLLLETFDAPGNDIETVATYNASKAGQTVYSGATINYTIGDNTNTIIYQNSNVNGSGGNQSNFAGGAAAGELLLARQASSNNGEFIISGIPTSVGKNLKLSYISNQKTNSYHTVTSSTIGVTLSNRLEEGTKPYTISYDITLADDIAASTFELLFSNSSSSNARIDDIQITTKSASISGSPSITPASADLVIAVASGSTNTASTTFTYTGALDSNPVVAAILEDAAWLTASISGSDPYTLTVSADKNTGAERSATVRLRGTGVFKDIAVTQPTALVANPAVVVVNGNGTFTASWSGVANVGGYKAYFGSTNGLEADPSSLTALTPSYDDGTEKWSVTKSGLTNGSNYYLYVKSTPADYYVAPAEYCKSDVAPTASIVYQATTGDLASWSFTSASYPANKTNFSATSGDCSESTFYLNGSGSTWNSTKGYAFTAVTDISISVVAVKTMKAGSTITLSADTFYNKASNAPMTGFTLAVSESEGSFSTTGLDVTSWSLSTSSATKSVTYTIQNDVAVDDVVVFKLTQTGKAGAGQGYFNNIVTSYTAL